METKKDAQLKRRPSFLPTSNDTASGHPCPCSSTCPVACLLTGCDCGPWNDSSPATCSDHLTDSGRAPFVPILASDAPPRVPSAARPFVSPSPPCVFGARPLLLRSKGERDRQGVNRRSVLPFLRLFNSPVPPSVATNKCRASFWSSGTGRPAVVEAHSHSSVAAGDGLKRLQWKKPKVSQRTKQKMKTKVSPGSTLFLPLRSPSCGIGSLLPSRPFPRDSSSAGSLLPTSHSRTVRIGSRWKNRND